MECLTGLQANSLLLSIIVERDSVQSCDQFCLARSLYLKTYFNGDCADLCGVAADTCCARGGCATRGIVLILWEAQFCSAYSPFEKAPLILLES
jgi:hypothetical protein